MNTWSHLWHCEMSFGLYLFPSVAPPLSLVDLNLGEEPEVQVYVKVPLPTLVKEQLLH